MNKEELIANILADLIEESGGVGPFGGERPEVKGNHLFLQGQGPAEEYVISCSGNKVKVSLLPNDDLISSISDDTGESEEDIQEMIVANYQNIDVADLVRGKTDLSFWMYLDKPAVNVALRTIERL